MPLNLSGGEAIRFSINLEPNTNFTGFESLVDGIYSLELPRYGTSSGDIEFDMVDLVYNFTSSTGVLEVQFITAPGITYICYDKPTPCNNNNC